MKAEFNKVVVPEARGKVSISDLINQCNAAAAKMGTSNDHKLLLMNCAYAMRQLVDRLHKFEHPEQVQ